MGSHMDHADTHIKEKMEVPALSPPVIVESWGESHWG